jgi:hypothetical protein
MSVQAITGGAAAQQVTPVKTPPAKPADTTDQKPQPVAADKVEISASGQSALQKAMQEATETPAQTAQEASKGDVQAQRLLARENAATGAEKPPVAVQTEKASNLIA